MPAMIGITEDQLFDGLGAWLAAFIPAGGTVFKSQANRVAQPPDPSIELTPILRVALSQPVATYVGDPDTGTGTITLTEPTRLDVQADFRGDGMGDVARAVKSAWRSIYGPAALQAAVGAALGLTDTLNVATLYCSDEIQSPFITGERQYAERWTVTLALQYNCDVTLAQSFFSTTVPVNTRAADVNNPVE